MSVVTRLSTAIFSRRQFGTEGTLRCKQMAAQNTARIGKDEKQERSWIPIQSGVHSLLENLAAGPQFLCGMEPVFLR